MSSFAQMNHSRLLRLLVASCTACVAACMPRPLDGANGPPCAVGWFERDGACYRGERTVDAGVLDAASVDSGREAMDADVSEDAGEGLDAQVDSGAGIDAGSSQTFTFTPVSASELVPGYDGFFPNGEGDGCVPAPPPPDDIAFCTTNAGAWSGQESWVALRIDLGRIPIDATIVGAALHGTVVNVSGGGPTELYISAEDAANPTQVTGVADSPNRAGGRPLRPMTASWPRPAAGWPLPATRTQVRSPDLAGLLTEVRSVHGGGIVTLWVRSPWRGTAVEVGFPHPGSATASARALRLDVEWR